MFKTLINMMIQQIDPRIVELQNDVEFYQTVVIGLSIVVGLLFLIVILQRLSLRLMKQGKKSNSRMKLPKIKKSTDPKKSVPAAGASVSTAPKDLQIQD